MGTPVTNFGKVTVSLGYNSAAVSVVLTTGHGSRLPSTFPYPLVWWNATDYPDPSDDPDREIVTVTARSSDTLTITRAAESTSASNKNAVGKTYKMALSITKAMWEELQARSLTQSHRGLEVMRHPTDQATSVLINADAIVMSDGEEISDWVNLNPVITASGANGLDTGAEQVSTWYEIWAIYNGTTKAAMFHRAMDYVGFSYATGEDASQGLRSAVDNSTVKISQSFQVTTAGPMAAIDAKLLKTGAPTGNVWFTIEANNGGAPSGTALATSDYLAASRLITTSQWVRIPFRTRPSLSAATTYHLVMQGDYTISAANFVSWRMDGSAGAYASGNKLLYDSDGGGVWTADTDDDMQFSVLIEENDAVLTLPTGYTQYAFLGYVYNDGSGDFRQFHQIGTKCFCGYVSDWRITNSFTTTTSTLFDLRSYLPPVPLLVDFTVYNGTATHHAMGNIRATDIVGTPDGGITGTVHGTTGAGWTVTLPSLALDRYCAMTAVVGGGTESIYVACFEF